MEVLPDGVQVALTKAVAADWDDGVLMFTEKAIHATYRFPLADGSVHPVKVRAPASGVELSNPEASGQASTPSELPVHQHARALSSLLCFRDTLTRGAPALCMRCPSRRDQT